MSHKTTKRKFCTNCEQQGHYAMDCPLPTPFRPAKRRMSPLLRALGPKKKKCDECPNGGCGRCPTKWEDEEE